MCELKGEKEDEEEENEPPYVTMCIHRSAAVIGLRLMVSVIIIPKAYVNIPPFYDKEKTLAPYPHD